MSKIEELKASSIAQLEAIRALSAKAEGENRDLSDEEKQEIERRFGEVKAAKDRMSQLEKDAQMLAGVDALASEFASMTAVEGTKNGVVKGSVGSQFADHVQSSLKAFPGGLSNGADPRGIISPFSVAGGAKTLITGTGASSGGAVVFPQDLGIRDTGGIFQRPLRIRDVITTGTTNSDTVEFVKVTGFTNSASVTPEATAASGTTGTKPESALTFIRVTESVKTIAHWVPITNRALSDAGQVRTIVDNFLRYGLEEETENQIVNGTGTGEDFTGLKKLADDDQVQDQAWATDLLTTLRKARTLVALNGRAIPNAYLLNPADTERLDLATAASAGTYFYGGPANAAMMIPRVWGVPVVETEAVPSGVGYVGDFRQCVLWDREQASVSVGTINDQFVRNIVTILAEMRAAFGVFRPQAIVRIDLTA